MGDERRCRQESPLLPRCQGRQTYRGRGCPDVRPGQACWRQVQLRQVHPHHEARLRRVGVSLIAFADHLSLSSRDTGASERFFVETSYRGQFQSSRQSSLLIPTGKEYRERDQHPLGIQNCLQRKNKQTKQTWITEGRETHPSMRPSLLQFPSRILSFEGWGIGS